MPSRAVTVDDYLAELADDRRELVAAVRALVNAHLPMGYEEGMQYGMIGWFVPHSIYPAGYHTDPKQPLPYLALASQKNHLSLYLMGLYVGAAADGSDSADVQWLRTAWAATGKKLDLGKSCLRFKRLDDLALNVVAEAVARIPVATYIERYEAMRAAAKR